MKYKLVIFDLDGTVLNTLDDLADSVNHALAAHAYPARTVEEVRSFVGNGIRRLISRAVPPGTDEKSTESVFSEFVSYYGEHCALKTCPYPGIPALLHDLRADGCLLAVLSNKADFAVSALCERYFPDAFDYLAGEKEGIPRKPDPAGVYAVLSALGVSAAEAVYIGDSDVDVLTAASSGLDCICVDWGFRTRAELVSAGARVIVSDAHALYGAITK